MTPLLPAAQQRRRGLAGRRLLIVTSILLMATGSGCFFNRTLKPSSLPRHFAAKPTQNAKTIDLSNLATNTTSDETIVPGDVLEVAIAAGLGVKDTVELSTRVDERGYAELPIVGQVHLAGLELDAAESAISTRSIQAGVYVSPHVTVTMKQPKMLRVTVAGAVKEPGTYELRPGSSDLLHALVVAGSLDDDAGVNVEIRQPGLARPGRTAAPLIAEREDSDSSDVSQVGYEADATPVSSSEPLKVNLASLERGSGDKYRLSDGAVVYVERRDPAPISIGGLVRKADRYEYPVGENLYLLDAISMAGGERSAVADKVFVIREVDRNGEKERGVIQVSLTKAKHDEVENILLMPGDVVTVEKTIGTVLLDTIQKVGFGVNAAVF